MNFTLQFKMYGLGCHQIVILGSVASKILSYYLPQRFWEEWVSVFDQAQARQNIKIFWDKQTNKKKKSTILSVYTSL